MVTMSSSVKARPARTSPSVHPPVQLHQAGVDDCKSRSFVERVKPKHSMGLVYLPTLGWFEGSM